MIYGAMDNGQGTWGSSKIRLRVAITGGILHYKNKAPVLLSTPSNNKIAFWFGEKFEMQQ